MLYLNLLLLADASEVEVRMLYSHLRYAVRFVLLGFEHPLDFALGPSHLHHENEGMVCV